MSFKISDEIIQRVKDENDIVDVISETVKLKRSGRNHQGLCPFHSEKTPSFSVSSDKQIYKCFGCGEAGNVITFVMKTKRFSFVEAIKYLAQRANIPIELDDEKTKRINNHKDRLYKLNVEAARFFFNNLKKSKVAQDYFTRRGISSATVRRFGLGYSLDSWDSLKKYLLSRGYSDIDLLAVGLIIKSQKGTQYDRFRNRLMFPVFDYMGRVIGFGGRVFGDEKPKYLNSPESIVFQKGTNLYGLNFALKNSKSRTFIIVEGYMDCISLHQYGITNVVASLGTALTEKQAKLLKRYCDQVIISYDADTAGQTATLRGLEILRKEGFEVKVLKVPSGKDPDEYIRANGTQAFQTLVEKALPLLDYRIKRAEDGINLKNQQDIIRYIERVTGILAELNPVEKDVYIKRISQETGIKEQAIYDLLKQRLVKSGSKEEHMNNIPEIGRKLYIEPANIKAARALLKIISMDEKNYEFVNDEFDSNDFILDSHRKVYDLIVEARESKEANILKYVEDRCDDVESSKEWTIISNMQLLDEDLMNKQLIQDYLKKIKGYKLEVSKKQIMLKIKECEAKGEIEQSLNLAKKLLEIKKKVEEA